MLQSYIRTTYASEADNTDCKNFPTLCIGRALATIPLLLLGPQATLDQRASSWFRGLYFHNIVQYVAIFLLTIISMRLKTEHITKEATQGRIKQVPKIKGVVPMRVSNALRVEKHPPNSSPGSQPFQIWAGT